MRPFVNSIVRPLLAVLPPAAVLAACASPGSPPEVIQGPVSVEVPVTDSVAEEHGGPSPDAVTTEVVSGFVAR